MLDWHPGHLGAAVQNLAYTFWDRMERMKMVSKRKRHPSWEMLTAAEEKNL